MQAIQLNCISCGEIRVLADEICFFRNVGVDQPRCVLNCPQCNELILKEIHTPELASDLVRAGCKVMPPPPPELYEPHSGPPWTIDDLLDLCLLLETSTWYEQLLATPTKHEKAA
jgi:hypothetical protein